MVENSIELSIEKPKKKKGRMMQEEIIRDEHLGFEIVPFENPDGSIVYYLNRLWQNKRLFRNGTIICQELKVLKDLKKFLSKVKGL